MVVRASSAANGLISIPCRISGPTRVRGTPEAERLAFVDGAIFDVLDALQGEIEKIPRAAGGVQNAQPRQLVDEGVAQRFGLYARRGIFLSCALWPALPAGRGLRAGRMICFDLGELASAHRAAAGAA